MNILINDGWSFAKVPYGSSMEDAEKAVWQPVDLPHDWLIWQKDLYESADVWYKREIELPEDHEPVVMIRFDGVYMDCDVLLNEEIICTHPYGYTAFNAELTGKIKPGKNLISVHIRHYSPNSRWYSGSGIYRDVRLVTLPHDHIVPDSLYLNTKEEQGKWTVRLTAEADGKEHIPFRCILRDSSGCISATGDGFSEHGKISCSLQVNKARPWSVDDPYLYELSIIYNKHTITRKIGLRSVSVSSERGFLLNGRNIRLKGVCLHHDLGSLGAAFHRKAAARQLSLMQKMGANAIRTSHNPPAAELLDLCDEMGILVIDEAFDMWEKPKTEYDYARFFPEWYEKDVASWIRRDRCHPCVIMWSIGNEIYDMHAGPRGEEITRILCKNVRKHDPDSHAYTTFGCNYMPWEGGQHCANQVDIVGYNYGEKLYEAHHTAHPSWIIYGSETGSILSSRGIYHFPIEQSILSENDRQCSALGNSNTSWGADSLARILTEDKHHPYSLGQFIWSGIDYIGEPTPYHTRSCYFGQADTACFPKDSYFLIQSLWTEKKMIHIGVSWDWNPGQMIDIPVMTNCAETELFLNGQSKGRKRPDCSDAQKCLPVWKIPFEPGELSAKGFDEKGNLICEDRRYTPECTDHFVISCENEYILSDGYDLAFVTVKAEDLNGHSVDNARDRIKITVSGGGRLIGTDNGDSTDPDSYKADCRRLFSGRLLLIIGSNGLKQDITVRAEDRHGKHTEIVIPVKHCTEKEGCSHFLHAVNEVPGNEVSARKLEIIALDPTILTRERPNCRFRFAVIPEEADAEIIWQVTNAAGIETPYVNKEQEEDMITVQAHADGEYYLRGLCCSRGKCEFISQMEFSAEGLGKHSLDPYTYLSAGLYDIHEGEIGTGNEKGIAFARDGESMIGFSSIDFGRTGTNRITADIFALNGEIYEMELWTGRPGGPVHLTDVLCYQKPSIWNVYQPETWSIKERLTGILTVQFRMRDKVHMKGFVFEKQQYAFLHHTAASADTVYGDQFEMKADSVCGIGNNVTLSWNDMDFGSSKEMILRIAGRTTHPVNTISIRIRNDKGEEKTSLAEFKGFLKSEQDFRVCVPEGKCSVSFVFLPGSSFDFDAFRFYSSVDWTESRE